MSITQSPSLRTQMLPTMGFVQCLQKLLMEKIMLLFMQVINFIKLKAMIQFTLIQTWVIGTQIGHHKKDYSKVAKCTVFIVNKPVVYLQTAKTEMGGSDGMLYILKWSLEHCMRMWMQTLSPDFPQLLPRRRVVALVLQWFQLSLARRTPLQWGLERTGMLYRRWPNHPVFKRVCDNGDYSDHG